MSGVFDHEATDRPFPPIAGPGRGYVLDDPLSLDEYIEARKSIRALPERTHMDHNIPSSPLPNPITAAVKDRFAFTMARRKTRTLVSDFVVPAKTPIQVDGQVQRPSADYRIAVESNGEGVYPVLESVFRETYEVAS